MTDTPSPVDPSSNPSPVDLDKVYMPSTDVVAREIEGELIIVPLVAGVGSLEDELYSMNDTGREVWRRLDGTRTLRQVAAELSAEFDAPAEVIEADLVGLLGELLPRRMVTVVE
jgi:hypothetical protein